MCTEQPIDEPVDEFRKNNAAACQDLEREHRHRDTAVSTDRLERALFRVENVLAWSYVDPSGECRVDDEYLAESLDCETLCTIRSCLRCLSHLACTASDPIR